MLPVHFYRLSFVVRSIGLVFYNFLVVQTKNNFCIPKTFRYQYFGAICNVTEYAQLREVNSFFVTGIPLLTWDNMSFYSLRWSLCCKLVEYFFLWFDSSILLYVGGSRWFQVFLDFLQLTFCLVRWDSFIWQVPQSKKIRRRAAFKKCSGFLTNGYSTRRFWYLYE